MQSPMQQAAPVAMAPRKLVSTDSAPQQRMACIFVVSAMIDTASLTASHFQKAARIAPRNLLKTDDDLSNLSPPPGMPPPFMPMPAPAAGLAPRNLVQTDAPVRSSLPHPGIVFRLKPSVRIFRDCPSRTLACLQSPFASSSKPTSKPTT